ncbi:ABC transporter ATP-binding protein [Labrys wisconsinensis]|uniref:Branched-chain amino acid transport system ATP-binding protein n=1 Tax=Labrys wisconsinensis TaxID=425677 RepID=A0ABU0JAH5_9HYPH|nr:ABC transporter ATP-binding protein [Labrys wisconsinensis]MDQ0470279.1 branched-chain amino acid transport system ATP-binding protein [Labrys wisconsinensis]
MAGPLLQLRDVSLAFRGVQALTGLSFDVAEGEICALIGPNGAGKSSLLNVINGVYRADAGEIVFDGRRFEAISPFKAAHLGIGRTFQHNALFKRLTVLDNVLAGLGRHSRTTLFENAFHIGRDAAEERAFRARAERIIAFLDLTPYAGAVVSTLPYGTQKRVDLARALVGEPRLLLLDEPMAGMNQEEKQEMAGFVAEVNASFGTTIVLIEHDVGIVMGLAGHVVVLDYGRKVADGAPEAVRSNPDVIAAYLGTVH